jgi:hypothetical protein
MMSSLAPQRAEECYPKPCRKLDEPSSLFVSLLCSGKLMYIVMALERDSNGIGMAKPGQERDWDRNFHSHY